MKGLSYSNHLRYYTTVRGFSWKAHIGCLMQISTGNALQCTTRDFYRLGVNLDLPRLLSLYYTSAGHFLSNKLTIVTLKLLAISWLVVALLRAEQVCSFDRIPTLMEFVMLCCFFAPIRSSGCIAKSLMRDKRSSLHFGVIYL